MTRPTADKKARLIAENENLKLTVIKQGNLLVKQYHQIDRVVKAVRYLIEEPLHPDFPNTATLDPILTHWSHTTGLTCPRCVIDAALAEFEESTNTDSEG
jgi:hypothetical protein